MYNLEINENNKVFLMTMSGVMTKTEVISYVDEFEEKVKKINPVEYSIVVDVEKLKAFPLDFNMTNTIGQAIRLIICIPFKARYSIMPKSVVAAWQIERIGKKNTSFYNMIFTESYEDVLKLL